MLGVRRGKTDNKQMNKQKNTKWLKSAMKKGKQDIGLTSDGIIFRRVDAALHVDLHIPMNTRKSDDN